MTGEAKEALELDDPIAWMGRYECGCVVAVSIGGEDDWVFTEDPEIVAVEQTTVSAARNALTSAHSRRPCELIAEVERLRAQRDEARTDLYGLLGAIDGFRDCCAGGSEIGERELLDLRRDVVRVLSRTEDGTKTRRCTCPTNEAGDIRCHVCGEYVNVRCWKCRTPRGAGPCPNGRQITAATKFVARSVEDGTNG